MTEQAKKRPEFRNINFFKDLPTYRLPPAGIVSILHRISGLLMFILLPFILWMMDMSLTSEISFDGFTSVFAGPFGWFLKLVCLALIWAYLHHFCAGGSKRTVVGAHYGIRDWMVQRVTGVLMALFTIVLLAKLIFSTGSVGYDLWAGIFAPQWMKFLTFAVIVSLAWHVWVGVRDIWMDYVKPVGLRLVLNVFTLVWLVGCAGWGIQILWRI